MRGSVEPYVMLFLIILYMLLFYTVSSMLEQQVVNLIEMVKILVKAAQRNVVYDMGCSSCNHNPITYIDHPNATFYYELKS